MLSIKRITQLLPSSICLLVLPAACSDQQPLEPDPAGITQALAEVQATVIPIPQQQNAQPVTEFLGEPAVANPILAQTIPQNRFLAPNGFNNIHDDAYMSDTYAIVGPLGQNPEVFSAYLGSQEDPYALPISMGFDRYGRILMIAAGQNSARLLLLDPATLSVLAALPVPTKLGSGGSSVVAGSYFYLDQLGRAVLPTATGQIWVVDVAGGWNRPRLDVKRVYDLTDAITVDDQLGSVIPDFSGTLWSVSKRGIVATINPSNGRVATLLLAGERIENSLATDETGGVYIASDYALYRFDANKRGEPVITWREEYDRGTRQKPGQFSQGTGTTPTLMGTDFVAITDNADPYMRVLVYRRATQVSGNRLVVAVPVFGANEGATENSLVATDRSIVVENNYGYTGPQATVGGQSTVPGLARIDLSDAGQANVVWTSEERVPSLVTKASVANGLIYTYTKNPGPGTTDAWYFTAIDFNTGQTVWKRLAGTGLLYNNHYSGLHIGPDGTLYVGVGGGVVALRDVP